MEESRSFFPPVPVSMDGRHGNGCILWSFGFEIVPCRERDVNEARRFFEGSDENRHYMSP
jgi:hypothetical protein